MKRRIVSVLLVAAMLLSLLCGCAAAPREPEQSVKQL